MTFFEMTEAGLARLPSTTLAKAHVWERRDLQAVLRRHMPELEPDLLVLAEEFGDWHDSKRRIDLLAIDRAANIVVVELKRGDTGVHMELQALRYAAMVSTITFEQAVTAYGPGGDEAILGHLGWAEPSEDDFAQDVRIILFSEDYSRELTTSILWLNAKGLDVSAYRVASYELDQRLLLDFQRIIPLREAEEYQVRVRNKQQVEQRSRRERVPWNGEFYVSYGSGRSWDDAVRFGFISGGGGTWYSGTLKQLAEGDRIWVRIPQHGYVGVGRVCSEAEPIDEFTVNAMGEERLLLDVMSQGERFALHRDDPERAELVVRVEWLDHVATDAPVTEKGLFANQNTVCKPTTPQWPITVERLKRAFPRWDNPS